MGRCYWPLMMEGKRYTPAHSIMPLPKQKLIWLLTWVLLGVPACQDVSSIEVEQP